MRISMYTRHIKTGLKSEEHDLKVGQYNEFYLPAIGHDHDAWIVINQEGKEPTTLHLKR